MHGEDSEDEGCQVQISCKSPRRSRFTFATGTSSVCPVYGAMDHSITGCSKFATFRPEERLKGAI